MDNLKKFEEMSPEKKISFLKVFELLTAVSQDLETEQQAELESQLSETVKKFIKPPAKQKTLDSWLKKSKSLTPEKPSTSSEVSNNWKENSPMTSPRKHIENCISDINIPESPKIDKKSIKFASKERTDSVAPSKDEMCVLNVQSSKQINKMYFKNPIVLVEKLDFKKLNYYSEITNRVQQNVPDFIPDDTILSGSSVASTLKKSSQVTNSVCGDKTISSLTFKNEGICSESSSKKQNANPKRKRTASKDCDSSSKRKTRRCAMKKPKNNLPIKKVSESDTLDDTKTLPNELNAIKSDCESSLEIVVGYNCEDSVSKNKLQGKKKKNININPNIKQTKTSPKKLCSKNKSNLAPKPMKEHELKNTITNPETLVNEVKLKNKVLKDKLEILDCSDVNKFSDSVLDASDETTETAACKKNLSKELSKVSSKNVDSKRNRKKTKLSDNTEFESSDSDLLIKKIRMEEDDCLAEKPASLQPSSINLNKDSDSNSKPALKCKTKENIGFSYASNQELTVKPLKNPPKRLPKYKNMSVSNMELDIFQLELNSADLDQTSNKKGKNVNKSINVENNTGALISKNNVKISHALSIKKTNIQSAKSDATTKSALKKQHETAEEKGKTSAVVEMNVIENDHICILNDKETNSVSASNNAVNDISILIPQHNTNKTVKNTQSCNSESVIKPLKKTFKNSCKNKKENTNKLVSIGEEQNSADADQVCTPENIEMIEAIALNNDTDNKYTLISKDNINSKLCKESMNIESCKSKSVSKKTNKKLWENIKEKADQLDSVGVEQNLTSLNQNCTYKNEDSSALTNIEIGASNLISDHNINDMLDKEKTSIDSYKLKFTSRKTNKISLKNIKENVDKLDSVGAEQNLTDLVQKCIPKDKESSALNDIETDLSSLISEHVNDTLDDEETNIESCKSKSTLRKTNKKSCRNLKENIDKLESVEAVQNLAASNQNCTSKNKNSCASNNTETDTSSLISEHNVKDTLDNGEINIESCKSKSTLRKTNKTSCRSIKEKVDKLDSDRVGQNSADPGQKCSSKEKEPSVSNDFETGTLSLISEHNIKCTLGEEKTNIESCKSKPTLRKTNKKSRRSTKEKVDKLDSDGEIQNLLHPDQKCTLKESSTSNDIETDTSCLISECKVKDALDDGETSIESCKSKSILRKISKRSSRNIKEKVNKLDSDRVRQDLSDSGQKFSPKSKGIKDSSALYDTKTGASDKDDSKSALKKTCKKSGKNVKEGANKMDSVGVEQNLMAPDEVIDSTELENIENDANSIPQNSADESDILGVTKAIIQPCNITRSDSTTSTDSLTNYNAYFKISKLCSSLGLNVEDIFNNSKFKSMIESFRSNPGDAIVFIGTAKSPSCDKVEPTVMVHKSKKQLLEILSTNQFKNSVRSDIKD